MKTDIQSVQPKKKKTLKTGTWSTGYFTYDSVLVHLLRFNHELASLTYSILEYHNERSNNRSGFKKVMQKNQTLWCHAITLHHVDQVWRLLHLLRIKNSTRGCFVPPFQQLCTLHFASLFARSPSFRLSPVPLVGKPFYCTFFSTFSADFGALFGHKAFPTLLQISLAQKMLSAANPKHEMKPYWKPTLQSHKREKSPPFSRKYRNSLENKNLESPTWSVRPLRAIFQSKTAGHPGLLA